MEELLYIGHTVVLFESPRRLKDTLKEVAQIDPLRSTVIARELTKKFEEIIRGTVSELLGILESTEIKGEVVFMFGPAKKEMPEATVGDLRNAVVGLVEKGMPKKQAISEVSRRHGVKKRLVYEAVIDIHDRDFGNKK